MVDGYQFDTAYHRAIKTAGRRLLVIDDYGHADAYVADLVLNQNVHADESLYQARQPETRLLLGTRYAMLRREFWTWRGWRRAVHRSPTGCWHSAVRIDNGPNSHRSGRQARPEWWKRELLSAGAIAPIGAQSRGRFCESAIRLETNITDMPPWLTWADAAVTAAGGTLWELAFFGTPSVTVVLAENQTPAARWLADHQIYPTLGWGTAATVDSIRDALRQLLVSCDLRRSHSARASALIDGNGVFRVVDAMKEFD